MHDTTPTYIDELQNLLNDKLLFTQESFLNDVLQYMTPSEIKDTISCYACQSILDVHSFVIAGGKDFPSPSDPLSHTSLPIYRSSYPPLDIHLVFNDRERLHFKLLLTELSIPTTYITPHGKVTVNYDISKKLPLLTNIEDGFSEYLQDLLNVHERIIIFQHFI